MSTALGRLIGRVLNLPEEDYCYGRGPLRLRVLHVRGVREFAGAQWLDVRGDALAWDDRVIGERNALVRIPRNSAMAD